MIKEAWSLKICTIMGEAMKGPAKRGSGSSLFVVEEAKGPVKIWTIEMKSISSISNPMKNYIRLVLD